MSVGIGDIVHELVRRNNAALERAIGDYIRSNRTTRLDIELVWPHGPMLIEDDRTCFFRPIDRDAYTVRCRSEFYIRQKTPRAWRAPLPD
jgi:hypothetical protein